MITEYQRGRGASQQAGREHERTPPTARLVSAGRGSGLSSIGAVWLPLSSLSFPCRSTALAGGTALDKQRPRGGATRVMLMLAIGDACMAFPGCAHPAQSHELPHSLSAAALAGARLSLGAGRRRPGFSCHVLLEAWGKRMKRTPLAHQILLRTNGAVLCCAVLASGSLPVFAG